MCRFRRNFIALILLFTASNTAVFGEIKVISLKEARPKLAEAGLEVIEGQTQVIIPVEEACEEIGHVGKIVRFGNGDLLVSCRAAQMRSVDGGKTWQKVKKHSAFRHYATNLSNGETIQWRGRVPKADDNNKTSQDGFFEFSAVMIRTSDNGLTEQQVDSKIYLPEGLKITNMYHARIIELADGSLLFSTYGRFHKDAPGYAYGSFRKLKDRTFVMRSTDMGKTWRYLSTVAFDLWTKPRVLGFDEPEMVMLSDGLLLCFLRADVEWMDWSGPMYLSFSNDNGMSWCHADIITEFGVCPYAKVLENGVIAVVYGRPGSNLMFSADKGQTWVGHFRFFNGPAAADAGNYCALEEVAPNKLLVVYGRKVSEGSQAGEVVGTYFTVKRKK